MKPIYKFLSIVMLLIAVTFASCEGEKDLVVIEGNLPIKTNTLYMVGDATPTGWNIDAPTAFTPSQEDPLETGNWGGVFVMPVNNGCKISKSGIENTTFSLMPTGNPDNKWKVEDAGKYKLIFDLRNWTVSAIYISE